jgi:hypothetical protein
MEAPGERSFALEWRNLVKGVTNVRGKGGRMRVVRLSRSTRAELQALRPPDALGDDRVFALTAWNAWDRVRRGARAAGIDVLVSPHFLRHSHGIHTLRRGADLATVRETLGHASLETIRRKRVIKSPHQLIVSLLHGSRQSPFPGRSLRRLSLPLGAVTAVSPVLLRGARSCCERAVFRCRKGVKNSLPLPAGIDTAIRES